MTTITITTVLSSSIITTPLDSMSDYIKSTLAEFHRKITELQNKLDEMASSPASLFLGTTKDPKYEGRQHELNRKVKELKYSIDQLKETYKIWTGRNYDDDAAFKELIEESEEFWISPATDEFIVKILKEVLNMDTSDPNYRSEWKQAFEIWWAMIINKDKDKCCDKCCCNQTQSEMCKLAHSIFEFDPCECHTIENQAFKNLELVQVKLYGLYEDLWKDSFDYDLYYDRDTNKTDDTLSVQIDSLEKQLDQLQRRLTC